MSNWRKIENENGYPMYLNEFTNVKQWDHPKFADIKQNIDDCNYIKYTRYRVAAKLRVLQRALYMDEIPIAMINGIFEKHRLGQTEASLNLESYDLEAILADIFFAANKQNHTNTDIDFASELVQNFLYNIYDKNRQGKLQVVSTKLALGILSSSKLSELYKYIFYLCSDYNNTVTKLHLRNVLQNFNSIVCFLHEDINFDKKLLQKSIEECFKDSPGAVGITENNFLSWLESGPDILSYVPILYRMRTAETVMHNARCTVCKTTPLLGLKYRCLRCSRYIQCQKCFLTARTSGSHKVSHPMREYCTEKCPKELSHMFIKRLCSILRCSLKVPTQHNSDTFAPKALRTDKDKDFFIKPSEIESENKILPLSSPQMQLQVIIRQLELQNKELQTQMFTLHSRNDKDMKRYLEEHRLHVATQIQKLKTLKDYLQNCQKQELAQLESTPMIKNGHRRNDLDMYSPIIQQTDFSVIPEDISSHNWDDTQMKNDTQNSDPVPFSIRDISSWLGERPATSTSTVTNSTYIPLNTPLPNGAKGPVQEMQHDLDAVLDKLQQILANNIDDSLSMADNDQLQEAVTEMEGMLTSLIDGVESSRSRTNSALSSYPEKNTILF